MELFSERNGFRKPIEKTDIITKPAYCALFNVCENYLINLAYKYPVDCPDGKGVYDINRESLSDAMYIEIPDLYRDIHECIEKPGGCWETDNDDYDQYALLDYIEYIANNIRDYQEGSYHSFFSHTHLSFLKSSECFEDFQNEINTIFKKTGLQYILTDSKRIERVTENSDVIKNAFDTVQHLQEQGAKDLIEEALVLYKSPRPESRRDAMEKIWDAFERIKTYYPNLNKKQSADKVIDNISQGNADYKNMIEEEFHKLTSIGNSFRIRHHETDKIDITDPNFYDYFFERCLSTVLLAVKYLK